MICDEIAEAKRLIEVFKGSKENAIKATEQMLTALVKYPEHKFYKEVLQQIKNQPFSLTIKINKNVT